MASQRYVQNAELAKNVVQLECGHLVRGKRAHAIQRRYGQNGRRLTYPAQGGGRRRMQALCDECP